MKFLKKKMILGQRILGLDLNNLET